MHVIGREWWAGKFVSLQRLPNTRKYVRFVIQVESWETIVYAKTRPIYGN